MNEIKDTKLLDTYIKRNHIHSFFSDFELCYPHMTLAEFPKNTFICCDSDYRGYFYFFVEGNYKVYGNLRNGKRILYRFCNSFSVLGETEFLLDETYHAEIHTVETTNRCVVVLLDYRDIMPVLLEDAKFLHFICRVLAEKLSYFGNMQMINTLSSAREKVAIYLVNSVDHSGIFCENHGIVAEQLDISYRHFHRILQQFAHNGWIARMKNGYRIIRPDMLRQIKSE